MSDNEIVDDFLVESYENLDRLDRELVSLEKNPGDRDALAGVFRTIHTIKGTCGFLGLAKLEKVAHAGENLLAVLRDGKLGLNPEITTALLKMVDAIRQMLAEIQVSGQDGTSEYSDLLETLKRLQSPSAAASASTQKPEDIAPPAVDDKSRAHMPSPEKIGGVLVECGLVSTGNLAEALQKQDEGDKRKIGDILVSQGHINPGDVALAQAVIESRSNVSAGTVRVGVNLLDNLMTLVGELVLARNQLLQFANTSEDMTLQGVSQRMNLIATELQGQVMKTRMQPIGNVWNQIPRTVRDVALSCNKEVRIDMGGKETELDKTIIEAIKDPLTHLVRNAVDHGIELPADRVKLGKDRTGRLILRAFHEGGQVNIEIVDDGAGLNRDRIRQKAIERALVTADHAARLPDREIFNMIFLPGFSTAAQVTNVSGRGVGMDVVKTNVEKIGGTVDVHSKPGEGTTVRVKIPLTLAIIPALVVTSAGERFAIPQVNLTELVRVEGGGSNKRIELVHGAPVYRLRGRLLPLVYLGKELQLDQNARVASTSSHDRAVNIVVLQAGERQFGLVVDEVNDTQEIVVKPLRKQLKGIKTFAGASIMGDGKIALILDVMGVAQRSGVISEARDRALAERAAETAEAEKAREKQTFLLFAGPDDSCMALPIETLDRLEEFPASQLEQSGSQWVAQYRGRILPLVRLEYALDERRHRRRSPKASAEIADKQLQVLVCHNDGQTVGVVVERIFDIVEDIADVKYPATRAGVLYSAVINGRVTELLDIPAVLRSSGLNADQPLPAEVVH
ncbi:MAG: chemotaxis protein CheW [Candidatus Acidiferrales bacterium]